MRSRRGRAAGDAIKQSRGPSDVALLQSMASSSWLSELLRGMLFAHFAGKISLALAQSWIFTEDRVLNESERVHSAGAAVMAPWQRKALSLPEMSAVMWP